MLEVTFYRDERDRVSGFSARGHADYERHGKDIVCAAVSAVLQAAQLGLTAYAKADVTARQGSGELRLAWPKDEGDWESVRAIVATAELAVEQIARRFPENVRLKRARAPRAPGGKAPRRVTLLADRRRVHDV
ncbi:MAG: ribosomal-processing cysteine protease Prp [Candidatus Cybelea sp.]